MKKRNYSRLFFCLALVSGILVGGLSHAQDLKSKVVRFRISNMPDREAPVIKVIKPSIGEDGYYRTSEQEIVLIGEVTDENGIRFVTVNDDMRSVNDEGLFTSGMSLETGVNKVRLIAADREDNMVEREITIEYVPPVVTLADKIAVSSTYYGLIIGIEEYQDPNLPDLDNPISDAEMLYNTLVSNYSFVEDNMMMLRNAKRNDIVNALDLLSNIVTPSDNLLIFYAGHGNWDERSDVGYWLPADAYMASSAN